MQADTEFKMPFNFVQVLIAAFGAMAMSVLIYFGAMAAGVSMSFSGGAFQNLDFIHIVRITVPPIVLLGFLTFLIGRSKPGFCKIAQGVGVLAVVAVAVTQLFFAEDWGTAVAAALMLLVVAGSWFIAVNNSNAVSKRRSELAG